MKKVKDILPSIFYLLLIALIVTPIVLALTYKPFNEAIFGEKVSSEYRLKEGINYIGLDFRSKDRAFRILKENENISLIADYKNGEWDNVINDSSNSLFFWNNFKLKEYNGYLVITDSDTVLTLDGRKRKDEIKFDFKQGEYLIGGLDSSTSSELIERFKSEGVEVLGTSVWSKSKSHFESFVVDSNKIYGNDIDLSTKEGIFIKIK